MKKIILRVVSELHTNGSRRNCDQERFTTSLNVSCTKPFDYREFSWIMRPGHAGTISIRATSARDDLRRCAGEWCVAARTNHELAALYGDHSIQKVVESRIRWTGHDKNAGQQPCTIGILHRSYWYKTSKERRYKIGGTGRTAGNSCLTAECKVPGKC